MDKYERLEELRKEVVQLQMEINELERELHQECNENWYKLHITQNPPTTVMY